MRKEPGERVEELKAVVGLRPEDERRIAELWEEIEPRLDEVVTRYVETLQKTGPAPGARLEGTDELHRIHRSYLKLLFGGRYDAEFLDERARIASRLITVRPPSRCFPHGYRVYFDEIPRLLFELYAGREERLLAMISAVSKILLFDMQVACQICLGHSLARMEGRRDRLRAIVEDEKVEVPRLDPSHRNPLESYPEMIVTVNEAGMIVDANRAALESLGYDADEVHELTIRHLIAESHHPRIRMHFDRAWRNGSDRIEARLLTREGEEKRVEIVTTAVRDEENRYIGSRIFFRDLSDRRRLEEEMIRWERLVAVGSMAAKVAHEIRNPLSSISLNVELLVDEIRRVSGRDEPEAASLVRSILSEIDRLTNVIEEYLSFGRLPSPSLEAVPLGPFLRSLGEFVESDLREHGTRLTIDVRPGTPRLLADKNQVRQGVLNLFRNAREAMPSGGEIGVIAGVRDGNVVIEVRDEGIGIPKEELQKIFDPFYTTKDYGTGLGLAFVQQVMREHGGRVTCRAKEGGGTVFTLHFPSTEE